MVLEGRSGERVGVTAAGAAEHLARAVAAMGLPSSLPAGLDPDEVLARAGRDKKARRGRTRYVLLRRLGEADPGEGWSRPVPEELVRQVLSGAEDPPV
jgi:3-dehydroquinate synthase